ncbi:hypothetical protein LUZ62_049819 [Rhynchospora pubera]|uniref:Pectinesterase inhibitor domain-containing protein n=1 Tax=Rhynchospora pubera TaxID=906938 RepID=A0AAV8G6M1_9POAL|nr:hypothetical protein LUZ62_049819 [Rhynchospora pubera]
MASMLPVVIFLALSISVSSTTATTSSNKVSEPLLLACKQTPEPEICLKYLSVFPTSFTGNIHNITALSISAASSLTNKIHDFVSSLEKKSAFSTPAFERCLKSSAVAIKGIAGRLNDLAKAVRDRSYADVSLWFFEAWTDLETAEQSCTGHNGQPQIPQLSRYLDDLRRLLRIILVFFGIIGN